jgi:hypothetical protein
MYEKLITFIRPEILETDDEAGDSTAGPPPRPPGQDRGQTADSLGEDQMMLYIVHTAQKQGKP